MGGQMCGLFFLPVPVRQTVSVFVQLCRPGSAPPRAPDGNIIITIKISMDMTDRFDISMIENISECMERIEKKLDNLLYVCDVKGRQGPPEFPFRQDTNVPEKESSLFSFMQGLADRLRGLGKDRTSETYRATLNSFRRFRNGRDILLEELDSDLMQQYEVYLEGRGVSKNTISFYMRILRAVYNRAVEKGMASPQNPFRHVCTSVEKTAKRAIPLDGIRRIKELDLSSRPALDWARDMFLFSFYTRGMSFVDMAYLKKTDLHDGLLSYRRSKTGQQLVVRWEKCMQEIADKYADSATDYLLPIITERGKDGRLQYQSALHLVNRRLKAVSKMAMLDTGLSMYVARHSWASIARRNNVPLSVISEGMGHESEATTQIYLVSLDNSLIDKANHQILSGLE